MMYAIVTSENPVAFKPNERDVFIEKTPTKLVIVKNCTVLSIAIMLYLSASLPSGELQSSINIKNGVGVYAEAARHFVAIFAYLIVPTLFMNKLGLKHTITIGLISITVYYLANCYVSWGTVIPAIIISSFGNSPVWPAKASYLTILSEQASKAFNLKKDHTLSVMFGFFYGFYYFGYLGGNVASYYILRPIYQNNNESNITEEQSRNCGLYFCDSDAVDGKNSNFDRPGDREIYILFGVFIGLTLLAALIVALFMDNVKNTTPNQSVLQLVTMTLLNIMKPKQLLLLPLGMSRAISTSFLTTEYTKAFVSCAWGIHNIGLVMISFGIVCGVSSLLLGTLVRYTGRIPLFVSAVLINIAVAVFVSQWKPTTDDVYLFFLVPCLMGYSNSVWESQVAALYPLIFPEDREVSFTIYNLSTEIGGSIARSYSHILCTEYKLIIFISSMGIGFVVYIVAELRYLRNTVIAQK